MSHDFVRQLPGEGLRTQRKAALGDIVHLDLPMVFLLLAISVYGLLILALLFLNPVLSRLKKGSHLKGSEYAVILTLTLAACSIPSSGLLRFFGNTLMLPQYWEKPGPFSASWQSEASAALRSEKLMVSSFIL